MLFLNVQSKYLLYIELLFFPNENLDNLLYENPNCLNIIQHTEAEIFTLIELLLLFKLFLKHRFT